jgi:hypothetical protein
MPETLSIFLLPVKAAVLRYRDASRIVPASAFIPSPPSRARELGEYETVV